MDDHTFARELTAWLDPQAIWESIGRYESDREQALAQATLIVGSGRLKDGDDGGYAKLVKKFLRGFRMPLPVVDLIRGLQVEPVFSDESLRWLAELTISSTVQVCSRETVPEGAPPNTVLLIEERDAVVDLLRSPVVALLDLVDRFAVQWRRVAMLSAPIYHEPNMPSAFYAFVDSQVGQTFLKFAPPLHTTGTRAPKFRYRAVTACGCQEQTDPMWDLTQRLARLTAAQTHEPIMRGAR